MLAGPNAPSPSTLTSWLMAHPSYEVMRPGVNPTSKYYNQSKPAANPIKPPANPIKVNRSLLRQTTLQTKPQGIQLIAALPQVTHPTFSIASVISVYFLCFNLFLLLSIVDKFKWSKYTLNPWKVFRIFPWFILQNFLSVVMHCIHFKVQSTNIVFKRAARKRSCPYLFLDHRLLRIVT